MINQLEWIASQVLRHVLRILGLRELKSICSCTVKCRSWFLRFSISINQWITTAYEWWKTITPMSLTRAHYHTPAFTVQLRNPSMQIPTEPFEYLLSSCIAWPVAAVISPGIGNTHGNWTLPSPTILKALEISYWNDLKWRIYPWWNDWPTHCTNILFCPVAHPSKNHVLFMMQTAESPFFRV